MVSDDSPLDIFGGKTPFFTEEAAIRELLGFGGTFPGESLLRQLEDGRATLVERGIPVRILERIDGGAKVAIATGNDAGRVGWMFEGSFTEVEPSEPRSGKGAEPR